MAHRADILLVAVTQPEMKAVRGYFGKGERVYINNRAYYDLGITGGVRIFLVQSEMGMTGLNSAIFTVTEGIQQLRPSAVIMVGIAFGIDSERQRVGDILVSRQVVGYDLRKVGSTQTILRGDRVTSSPRLLGYFTDATNDWEEDAKVRIGLILSGSSLVDNKDYRDELRAFEPEAVGGEMEAAGLYSAAQMQKTEWIMVKAICDWADGNKSHNKDENQELAANNAAKFTHFVIEMGGFARPGALHRSIEVKEFGEEGRREAGRKLGEGQYDTFFAYKSTDLPVVRNIVEALKNYGVLAWIAEDDLIPGRAWIKALEEQIGKTGSAVVFIGKDDVQGWHDAERQALLNESNRRNCPVIPVFLPGSSENVDLGFTNLQQGVDFRDTTQKGFEDAVRKLVWGITGKRVR